MTIVIHPSDGEFIPSLFIGSTFTPDGSGFCCILSHIQVHVTRFVHFPILFLPLTAEPVGPRERLPLSSRKRCN
ncbi:MAG: hypothetical protein ACI9EZ_001097 [Halobacteriales archaeon]|jgi:hypothetical protein